MVQFLVILHSGKLYPVNNKLSCDVYLLQTLYLPPGSCYTLFKPIKHGRLNVDDGFSLMVVANMLDDLWTKAIEDTLNIKKKRFKVSDSS